MLGTVSFVLKDSVSHFSVQHVYDLVIFGHELVEESRGTLTRLMTKSLCQLHL